MNKKQMLEIVEKYEFDIRYFDPYDGKKKLRIKDVFDSFVQSYRWKIDDFLSLKEKSFDKEAVKIFVEAIRENRSYVRATQCPSEIKDEIIKILKHYQYEYSGHTNFIVFSDKWENLGKIKHMVSMTYDPEYKLNHTKKTEQK